MELKIERPESSVTMTILSEQKKWKGGDQEEQVIQNEEQEEPPQQLVVDVNEMTHNEQRCVPLVLSFVNLTYTVNQRRRIQVRGLSHCRNCLSSVVETFDDDTSGDAGTKTLLHNVSGKARNGELLAVLGASGSGKSTLIDALANRISRESLKGSVTLNGEAVGGSLMKVISSYVMQDDLLFPMLTVEETFMFSAEFRLPRWLSKAKKRERVEALIDQLGLRRATKTVIGDESHRGVSGGERRRVSIGIDIIHDPIILFLDEPTSSLDSSSALVVIQVLKKIAQTGSIVILSIHQPSYRILNLLDRLIILSHGRTVYSGSPESLPVFLSAFGQPVPENESYVEFALDLVRDLETIPKEIKNLVEFSNFWQKNKVSTTISNGWQQELDLKDAIIASISSGKLVSGNREREGNDSSLVATFANPSWAEISVLAHRSLTNMIRKPSIFMTQLGLIIITGFFLAALFWNLGNSPKGVQERLGFFAFVFTFTFFITSDALPALLVERDIFNRETAHNAYRHSSYVITTTLLSIPHSLLLSIAFCIVTFPAVGLEGGAAGLFYFFLIIFSTFWAGTSFVSFLSSVVSSVLLGNTVVLGALAYFLLVSGFFINRNRIPDYLIWFHYLSAIKYPYEGILQSEFSSSKGCFSKGLQVFDNTPLKAMNSSRKEKLLGLLSREVGVDITDTTCMTTGLDILIDQGISGMGKWECLIMAMAWGLFFRILFYWALQIGSKNKRR